MELYYKILSAMESSGIDCGSYVELAKIVAQKILRDGLSETQTTQKVIELQLTQLDYITEE